jgi:hypothetical protein
MKTFDISALVAGYAAPTFPEVPQALLNEWVGETYPEGSWYADLCKFEGLEALVKALKRTGRATFTVATLDSMTFAIREAAPLSGKAHHGMAFPERAEGARGPLAGWSEQGENFALRCFICSRAKLGAASTWEVWREKGVTFARLVD